MISWIWISCVWVFVVGLVGSWLVGLGLGLVVVWVR